MLLRVLPATLVLSSFVSSVVASIQNATLAMKVSKVTAAALACPPICVSAYPKVLIAGDSTTAHYDQSKLQGWGHFLGEYVSMSVMNNAVNGRSTRSFRNEGLWARTLSLSAPGDFIIIEFGHNDDGDIRNPNNTRASRNTLPGTGDDAVGYRVLGSNRTEIVHTFGWYLKQMIIDVRERGAIPIVSSLTPRNNWTKGKNSTADAKLRTNYNFRDYAKTAAEELKAEFIDHNTYGLMALADMGEADAKKLFPTDNTHTNAEGARRKLNLTLVSNVLAKAKI
jgi:rhamnogalacturonan acetylesterase